MLRIQLAATDAENRENADGGSRDMDASTSVLGKRTRTMAETMDTGMAMGSNNGKRPRSEALEIASAADLEVEQ